MTTDIATHTDATDPAATAGQEEGSQGTVTLSAREAAMAAIENQVALQRVEEGVVVAPEDSGTQPGQSTTQTPSPAAAPATTAPQTTEGKVLVKVDGVEMELPISEVVKGYQKDAAASRRLEEAAQRLKDVEERERKLAEREKTDPTPAGEAGADDGAEDIARKILDSFSEGNVDEAAQILAKALAAKPADSTPVVDESKIAEIVKQDRIQLALEEDYSKAKKMFDTDYADINANPRLAQLCNNIYFEQIEAGKLPSEAAKIAGDEVRSLFPAAATNQTVITTRQERKQGIDTLTPAASVVTTAGGEAEAPNDPAAVIAEMKKARGQT